MPSLTQKDQSILFQKFLKVYHVEISGIKLVSQARRSRCTGKGEKNVWSL